ncbi:hypothetical protein F444_18118 [Phytophthora nicotianae P1976]|uniref:Uncharacterized protein n=1 Tax=Phytophthora nicotianae P1976 TaxID=1317066 RepID=A0A080ZCG4_PHYNI|nr:hypothetical protein F444_18118 [Phytophthora nicotianae P1976]
MSRGLGVQTSLELVGGRVLPEFGACTTVAVKEIMSEVKGRAAAVVSLPLLTILRADVLVLSLTSWCVATAWSAARASLLEVSGPHSTDADSAEGMCARDGNK